MGYFEPRRGILKKKKRLLYVFLIPLLGIVLFQGVVPFSMLFFSGVKENLEKNKNDKLVLSKGHASPALYSVLANRGYFSIEEIWTAI